MLTIDEIKIEADEDGFHLIVNAGPWENVRFRIGLPDQFLAETERTIGAWLAEGERSARQHQIDQGTAPDSRNVELDEDWREPSIYTDAYHEAFGGPDLARDIERGK